MTDSRIFKQKKEELLSKQHPTKQPAQKENKDPKKIIKIITHNIREINRLTDQDNILQELKKEEIDIIGLSEMNLTSRASTFSFKDQDDYKALHTCNDNSPYGAGVSILIHKYLAKHIHKIIKVDGHILALHLLFKGKNKLLVIQVYLTNDKQRSLDLQKQIQKIIGGERSATTNIIVMGDFNAANNPIVDRSNNSTEITKRTSHSWRSEISLFLYLKDLGFSDVHKDL